MGSFRNPAKPVLLGLAGPINLYPATHIADHGANDNDYDLQKFVMLGQSVLWAFKSPKGFIISASPFSVGVGGHEFDRFLTLHSGPGPEAFRPCVGR